MTYDWSYQDNAINPRLVVEDVIVHGKMTVIIGSYQSSTGGASSWEIQQNGKASITQSTTTPTIFQPTLITITIIGILRCMRYLTISCTALSEINFHTTTKIAKELQLSKQRFNQYWQQLTNF
jgi:hypothetical protein